jgi:hypothetical protein
VLVGSPSYISPERARGASADAAADLWGLGACLYAAVEGHPPFDREGALASLTAVVTEEPDPPEHAGALWPVISGLLRKDPDQRLSAHEVEEQLAPLAEPEADDEPEADPGVPVPSGGDRGRPVTGPLAAPVDTEARAAAQHGVEPGEASPVAPAEAAAGVAAAEAAPPGVAAAEAAAGVAAAEAAGVAAAAEAAQAGTDEAEVALPAGGGAAGADGPAHATPDRPPGRGRRRRRPRPRVILAAAAAAVVVAGIVVSVVLASAHSSGRHRAAAPPASSRSASASKRPTASPSARTSPTASPSASPSASASASGGSSAIPAGFYRFTNSTGFSIGVPKGWQVEHVGHYVYLRDPADSGVFLLIDQSDQPQPNALADWKAQASARQSSYPDYHLLRLQDVSYPQAEQAADWEFTYDRNGVPVHILNRNVLANSAHAYALYWSTPDSDWSADYHYFQTFAATFRPAP